MGIEHQGFIAIGLFAAFGLASLAIIWAGCVIAQEWEMAKWRGDDREGGE